MKYKVAAINADPILFQKETNVTRQLELAEEAAKAGAKLIALPEMANTGYCFYDRKEVKPYVETIPGPTTDRYQELAARYDCYIVTGMAEVDAVTDIYYNSAALIGPKGVIGVHRKTHSYISEPKWAKQGDLDHMVFDTPIGRIAMLICMDIHFIETARIDGLKGADIIVHVSNWLAEKTPAPYWITRAFDNGCYVLESNRCGLERTVQFSGGSTLINPDGTIANYVDEKDAIMYGEVDLEKARTKDFEGSGHKFRERKPGQYMELVQNPYLWNPLDFFGLYGHDPLPKGKISKAAVFQMECKASLEDNLNKIITQAEKAASEGAELLVLPEKALSGDIAAASVKAAAITVPGKEIDSLIDSAMKNNIYLVLGVIEAAGGKYYNTAVLIGPEGLLGRYRQLHVAEEDKPWASEGDLGFVYCNTPMGRIGLLCGHDALFPEAGRMLALQGVDVICCPSAVTVAKPYGLPATGTWQNYPIPMGYNTIHWHLWRTRAGENNCYLIFANQTGRNTKGKKYIGRSGIFGPDTFEFPRREVILSEAGEELGFYNLDTTNCEASVYPTNVVRRKDLVSMRQPLWYDIIVEEKPPVF